MPNTNNMNTPSEKHVLEVKEVGTLLAGVKALKELDYAGLSELHRKSMVTLRTILGQDHVYVKRLPKIQFAPADSDHRCHWPEVKQKAWNHGIRRFTLTLQSTIDELELHEARRLAESNDVTVPSQITLKWLWSYVPMNLWRGLAGALITAFCLGYAARTWQESHPIFTDAQSVKSTGTNHMDRLVKPLTAPSTNSVH